MAHLSSATFYQGGWPEVILAALRSDLFHCLALGSTSAGGLRRPGRAVMLRRSAMVKPRTGYMLGHVTFMLTLVAIYDYIPDIPLFVRDVTGDAD